MKAKIRWLLAPLVIVALLLSGIPAQASIPTVSDHPFYGTLTIEGFDAPVGTVITAEVGGVGCGSYITTEKGQYGSSVSSEQDYLMVSGDIETGATIHFFVDGSEAEDQTYLFEAGALPTRHNLTVGEADTTPPTVVSTIPEVDALDVPIDAVVSATFNEDIRAGDNFSGIAISEATVVSVTIDGAILTIAHDAFAYETLYEVTIPAGAVNDLADLPLAEAKVWSFTTGTVDITPPTVVSTIPEADATSVAITATVRATFSEVINSDTLAFSVGGVSGTKTYTGTTATFTPSANLGYSKTYTASVSASDLAGNPMAAYSWSFTTRAAPYTPPPYTPPAAPTIDTDLFGTEGSFETDSDGKIQETIEATSADGNLTITIPKDTVALLEGEPLSTLTAVVEPSPPDPPEDAHIIGLAYDFGPDGATFDPAITLEYTYDPDALPEDVAEEDLVVAYYDEATGEWVELDCVVDTENNTITASVAHFTTFAIIAVVPVVTPPAPAAFSVSSLSVLPAEVEPGETVTIAVLVANTGGEAGSYQVNLVINDLVEATKEVTVRAGLSKEVTFSVTKEEAGSYTVSVDGLSGSFTVG